jgi:uncharacterized protein YfeS
MLDKKNAHPLSLSLLNEDFYWESQDPNSIFGSVEGLQALRNYQKWQGEKLEELLSDTLRKLAKMELKDYNSSILNRNKIQQQIADQKFDDFRYILQVDGSIIAIILIHFIQTGKIESIPIFEIAIERLMLWNEYQEDFNAVCEQQIIQLYSMKQMLSEYKQGL